MTPRGPRPPTLRWGLACLAASLAIGVGILWFAWREPRAAALSLAVIGPLIAASGFWGWPRWLIAAVALASVAATLPEVGFQLSYGVVVPVATATQFALELAGFALLFHPRSHRWYHPRPMAG